jgi:hypothetical protein
MTGGTHDDDDHKSLLHTDETTTERARPTHRDGMNDGAREARRGGRGGGPAVICWRERGHICGASSRPIARQRASNTQRLTRETPRSVMSWAVFNLFELPLEGRLRCRRRLEGQIAAPDLASTATFDAGRSPCGRRRTTNNAPRRQTRAVSQGLNWSDDPSIIT